MARSKKTIFLPADFDVQVEEWQQFIDGIPGRTFDGVEIAEGEDGNVEIVAARAKTGDAVTVYSAVQKSEMQAYAASMAGAVASINDAKAG